MRYDHIIYYLKRSMPRTSLAVSKKICQGRSQRSSISLLLGTSNVMHLVSFGLSDTSMIYSFYKGQAAINETEISRLTSTYVYDETGLNVKAAVALVSRNPLSRICNFDKIRKKEKRHDVRWNDDRSSYSREPKEVKWRSRRILQYQKEEAVIQLTRPDRQSIKRLCGRYVQVILSIFWKCTHYGKQ